MSNQGDPGFEKAVEENKQTRGRSSQQKNLFWFWINTVMDF